LPLPASGQRRCRGGCWRAAVASPASIVEFVVVDRHRDSRTPETTARRRENNDNLEFLRLFCYLNSVPRQRWQTGHTSNNPVPKNSDLPGSAAQTDAQTCRSRSGVEPNSAEANSQQWLRASHRFRPVTAHAHRELGSPRPCRQARSRRNSAKGAQRSQPPSAQSSSIPPAAADRGPEFRPRAASSFGRLKARRSCRVRRRNCHLQKQPGAEPSSLRLRCSALGQGGRVDGMDRAEMTQHPPWPCWPEGGGAGGGGTDEMPVERRDRQSSASPRLLQAGSPPKEAAGPPHQTADPLGRLAPCSPQQADCRRQMQRVRRWKRCCEGLSGIPRLDEVCRNKAGASGGWWALAIAAGPRQVLLGVSDGHPFKGITSNWATARLQGVTRKKHPSGRRGCEQVTPSLGRGHPH